MTDTPQDKPPVPPAPDLEQKTQEQGPAPAPPPTPAAQMQPPPVAPAPAAVEPPASELQPAPTEQPQYSAEKLAERKRRGLDKGNIGNKSKGPLPKTSPATAVLMATILGALFVVTTIWTDRNVDFWWSYIQKGTHDVPMWVSAVITFVLAPIIIFLDLGSEAFRLMIDVID